jgi:hypothetical protein
MGNKATIRKRKNSFNKVAYCDKKGKQESSLSYGIVWYKRAGNMNEREGINKGRKKNQETNKKVESEGRRNIKRVGS